MLALEEAGERIFPELLRVTHKHQVIKLRLLHHIATGTKLTTVGYMKLQRESERKRAGERERKRGKERGREREREREKERERERKREGERERERERGKERRRGGEK